MSQAITRRALISAALALTAVVVPLAATASGQPAATSPASHTATRHETCARVSTAYDLPGARVYPEGIAADPRTGDIYVGSYATGAVYKATPGHRTAQVFLPPGTDGRTTANGLKVDRAGRLWVIDSTAGVAVYDLHDRKLIARFDVTGSAKSFVNDLAIASDGSAYLTDSYRGVLYRVTPRQLARAAAHGGRAELTTAYDLAGALPNAPAAGRTQRHRGRPLRTLSADRRHDRGHPLPRRRGVGRGTPSRPARRRHAARRRPRNAW